MGDQQDSYSGSGQDDFEAYMISEYNRMYLPELRELARRDGYSVPDRLSKEELIEVLLGVAKPPPNPIVEHKKAFMSFLRENKTFLRKALTCDGNCMNHPTELFLLCLRRSGQAKSHFASLTK